jgi:acyl-CoA thioester hydrolase
MEGQATTLPPATERASYRIWAFDKLRYCDTDRQGHVNNAVYATFFETGRVSFLYDNDLALGEAGCEFVIARLTVDFRAELYYPGRVDVGTRILSVGRSSFIVGQGVFKDETCAATGESVLVQMNTASRRAHPLRPEAVAWLTERVAS